jgi:hypothetical protein
MSESGGRGRFGKMGRGSKFLDTDSTGYWFLQSISQRFFWQTRLER